MRRPTALGSVLTLTAVLAACGQAPLPASSAPSGEGVMDAGLVRSAQELGRLSSARPSDVVYLIDGDTEQVYRVSYTSKLGANSLPASAVEVASIVPETNVQLEKQTLPAPQVRALAATCTPSDGPYYKSVYQGAIGFRHDVILPPGADAAGQGAAAFVYNGYATSSANVEMGFQKVYPDTTWQMYMVIRSSGRFDAPDTNGLWAASGWKFNDVRASGGSTLNLNSRSEIGSDNQHYLITDVVSGTTTYKVGYRTGGTTTINISSLRPSNAANIEVRKIVSLAGGAPLNVNSFVNLAKFRNSQYRSASGSLLTWPNTSTSRCANNYTTSTGTLYTKYDSAEASGSDTASISKTP